MAISTAEIHAAADALAAQGKRPTLAAVRAALGGGSFSTIGEALKTWHKPDTAHTQEKAQIPTAITESAAHRTRPAFLRLWRLECWHVSAFQEAVTGRSAGRVPPGLSEVTTRM